MADLTADGTVIVTSGMYLRDIERGLAIVRAVIDRALGSDSFPPTQGGRRPLLIEADAHVVAALTVVGDLAQLDNGQAGSAIRVYFKPCGCGVLVGEECDCAQADAELAAAPVFRIPARATGGEPR